MKKTPIADAYDSATSGQQAPAGGAGGFSDAYDSAPTADAPPADPDGDAAQDQPGDLDIPAADVEKMQELKTNGDMAGLGTYVSQFLK